MLLYVTNLHVSLLPILQECQRSGTLSNFKVNLSKSEILNLFLLPHQVQALRDNFSFKFCSSTFKYLGGGIPSDFLQLCVVIYSPPPLLSVLLYWSVRYDSWTGIGISNPSTQGPCHQSM